MRKNLVKTVDNDLSGDEILGRIEIGKTDERDLMAIGRHFSCRPRTMR